MFAHNSERITEKRNATLSEIDIYLDRMSLVMSECPSEYVRTVELIEESINNISSNIQKAKKNVHKAYRCAFMEADVIRSYQSIIDRISPDEPILSSPNFVSKVDSMRKNLYNGKVSAASRDVRKLKKCIGPNTRAPALSFNCLNSHMDNDGSILITITNNSMKTITFNGITSSSSPSSSAYFDQPVLHPMDSIEVRVKFSEILTKDLILKLSVEYTADLIPMIQNYIVRVFV